MQLSFTSGIVSTPPCIIVSVWLIRAQWIQNCFLLGMSPKRQQEFYMRQILCMLPQNRPPSCPNSGIAIFEKTFFFSFPRTNLVLNGQGVTKRTFINRKSRAHHCASDCTPDELRSWIKPIAKNQPLETWLKEEALHTNEWVQISEQIGSGWDLPDIPCQWIDVQPNFVSLVLQVNETDSTDTSFCIKTCLILGPMIGFIWPHWVAGG